MNRRVQLILELFNDCPAEVIRDAIFHSWPAQRQITNMSEQEFQDVEIKLRKYLKENCYDKKDADNI